MIWCIQKASRDEREALRLPARAGTNKLQNYLPLRAAELWAREAKLPLGTLPPFDRAVLLWIREAADEVMGVDERPALPWLPPPPERAPLEPDLLMVISSC